LYFIVCILFFYYFSLWRVEAATIAGVLGHPVGIPGSASTHSVWAHHRKQQRERTWSWELVDRRAGNWGGEGRRGKGRRGQDRRGKGKQKWGL
jgi:hypothetical protein